MLDGAHGGHGGKFSIAGGIAMCRGLGALMDFRLLHAAMDWPPILQGAFDYCAISDGTAKILEDFQIQNFRR